MRKSEALALSAESAGNDSPADLARRIGQLRICQDYERAFVKTTKVPLELYSIDTCREAHRIRSGDTNPVCSILTEANKTCSLCLKVREKLTDILETQTMLCRSHLHQGAAEV